MVRVEGERQKCGGMVVVKGNNRTIVVMVVMERRQ